jgi:uncharacterized protein YkwD
MVIGLGLGVSMLRADSRAPEPGPERLSDRSERLMAALSVVTPEEFAAALLAETNRVRRLHGVYRLRARPELGAAADDQAAFMALTLTAQHGSPVLGQRTVHERVRRHGLVPGVLAENVAYVSLGDEFRAETASEIAAVLVRQWMSSPSHRANLLSRQYTEFGGAVRFGRTPSRVWRVFGVQVFAGRPRQRGRSRRATVDSVGADPKHSAPRQDIWSRPLYWDVNHFAPVPYQ